MCLADKVVPHEASVVNTLRETSIWSQIGGHYFRKGGTVAAAVNIVIEYYSVTIRFEAKPCYPLLSSIRRTAQTLKF